ncbi:MAG: hypothetical protein ACJ74W_23120 [Pyrinomonadaceae bacterium]
MSDNHVLPAAKPFNWNWVADSEQADYHGAMAIKKVRFTSYLNQVLSPSLNQICIAPRCKVSFPDTKVKFEATYSQDPGPHTYRMVSDGTAKVLTFSYENRCSDSGGKFVVIWADIGVECKTQSDVYLENNVIRTSTLFNGRCRVNFEGGVVEGNYVRYQIDTSYQINVDSQGNLVVKLAEGSPKLTDLSETPNPDLWARFISFDQITRVINQLKNIVSRTRDFLTGHDQSILNIINGSSAWVFPGAQTFVYKDVYFSDHQDLVTHITYVDPT